MHGSRGTTSSSSIAPLHEVKKMGPGRANAQTPSQHRRHPMSKHILPPTPTYSTKTRETISRTEAVSDARDAEAAILSYRQALADWLKTDQGSAVNLAVEKSPKLKRTLAAYQVGHALSLKKLRRELAPYPRSRLDDFIHWQRCSLGDRTGVTRLPEDALRELGDSMEARLDKLERRIARIEARRQKRRRASISYSGSELKSPARQVPS